MPDPDKASGQDVLRKSSGKFRIGQNHQLCFPFILVILVEKNGLPFP